jgi:hypothetical protein
MKEGSSFSKKFGGESGNDSDYFRLLVKSVSSSNQILNTDTIYLADFRFDDSKQDYVLKDWEMAEIVSCDRVDFELQSTDVGQYGMNTPAYFCLSLAQDLTNSINNQMIAQLNVFPNPVNNILNIHSEAPIQSIQLITMDGRTVAKSEQRILSSNYSFDVSSFMPGIYFAKVYTSNGSVVSKFIKQ